MAEPTVSVAVLTHNRRDSVCELLDELSVLRRVLHEVIVVDNCSTDDTAQTIGIRYPWVTMLRSDRNVGIAARNLAMAYTTSDVTITLDDDILGLCEPDVHLIAGRFRDSTTLSALNFRVLDFFTRRVCNWVHHRSLDDSDSAFETYEITEGAVAFRTASFRQAGGYHELYFISHEGPDLAYRLMNAGGVVAYDGRITVLHKHEQTARSPERFYYYDTRNQFWLAARNMPAWDGLRYLARGQTAMLWYAVRDGFKKAWFSGVIDGLAGLPRVLATRQPWSPETAEKCRKIDSQRPAFLTLVYARLFAKANRLED